MMKLKFLILFVFVIIFVQDGNTETFYYNGEMTASIDVEWQRVFDTQNTLTLMTQIAEPIDYASGFNFQDIEDFDIEYNVLPTTTKVTFDRFGNKFHNVTWDSLADVSVVSCTIRYTVDLNVDLKPSLLHTSFPLSEIDDHVKYFLQPSPNVQSQDSMIVSMAEQLTENAATEHEAVSNILNWVINHVNYIYDPESEDALYTFEHGVGHCENYAHLSCALLRAVGIPARVVGGLSLSKEWSVRVKRRGTLTQGGGQGLHAWIEVYYPEIGWVPYDPQQTFLFISTRLIRNAYGLDAREFSEKLRGSPSIPPENEFIEPVFHIDQVRFNMRDEIKLPVNYIISGFVEVSDIDSIKQDGGMADTLLMASRQKNYLNLTKNTIDWNERCQYEINQNENQQDEFGFNLSQHRIHQTQDGYTKGQIVDKYVTESGGKAPRMYAQAVMVNQNFELEEIQLLMYDYGSFPGKIWIELCADQDGIPKRDGIKSQMLIVGKKPHQNQYRWFKFHFPEKKLLPPGKYWIVLHHDGNAIMNWRGVSGNPYCQPDDTLSTLYQTIDWNKLVNIDFCFKIIGNRQ